MAEIHCIDSTIKNFDSNLYLSTHLNGLIDIMLSERVCRHRTDHFANGRNNTVVLREFNTISVGLARQSGHTRAIKDVILKRFKNSLICFSWGG